MHESEHSECSFEEYLEQCPAFHCIIGPDRAFLRVYGDSAPLFRRPAHELLGRRLTDVLQPDVRDAWLGRLNRIFCGETVYLRETHGGVNWSVTGFPVRAADGTVFAGCMARDISPWSTAEQELRYTVLGALKAQEYERSTVSRFLHDSVGQNLSALGLQLDLVRMDLETVSPQTGKRISEIQGILEDIMQEVRDFSYELNPETVERAGLRAALDRMAGRIRSRFPGAVRIIVDPSARMQPKVAVALFHIAQEAVQNAIQHSGCSTIEIAVKTTRSGPIMEVRDNGRGFDPGDASGGRRGLGLLSMEHYAAQAGLDLSINSSREAGTIVRAAAFEGA